MEAIINRMGMFGLSCVAAGTVASQFCFVVDGGEKRLIFDRLRGLQDTEYGEGIHFKLPLIQSTIAYQIRTQVKFQSTKTISADLQEIHLGLRLLYRPKEGKLAHICDNLGRPDEYADRALNGISLEVLKSTVAEFNAEQLVTQREKVSNQIRSTLIKRCDEFDILLDDVSITDLHYSNEFTHSIEMKQVAYQESERAKFTVGLKEQEAMAAVIRAEGDAESARIIDEATREAGSGLITLRKLEASKEIAELLALSSNITFLSGNTVNMLNISGSGM